MEDDVCDFMQQCVKAYLEVVGEPAMKRRAVATPFLPEPEGRGDVDDVPDNPTDEEKGQLASNASAVLMKILYGARADRWGLLKAVQLLATFKRLRWPLARACAGLNWNSQGQVQPREMQLALRVGGRKCIPRAVVDPKPTFRVHLVRARLGLR